MQSKCPDLAQAQNIHGALLAVTCSFAGTLVCLAIQKILHQSVDQLTKKSACISHLALCSMLIQTEGRAHTAFAAAKSHTLSGLCAGLSCGGHQCQSKHQWPVMLTGSRWARATNWPGDPSSRLLCALLHKPLSGLRWAVVFCSCMYTIGHNFCLTYCGMPRFAELLLLPIRQCGLAWQQHMHLIHTCFGLWWPF